MLEGVTLSGKHRRKYLVATFVRIVGGWQVNLNFGGKEHDYKLRRVEGFPCWSTAMKLADRWECPALRPRAEKPEMKLYSKD